MFSSSFDTSDSKLSKSPSNTNKSVRINTKAQDLELLHTARLTRQLRRMKRKLLLDAMANDPTNAGYAGAGNASMSSFHVDTNNNSSSSLRFEDHGDDDESDHGEAAFRRHAVRYHHTPSNSSLTFDSNSSLYSDFTESEMNEIQSSLRERRDAHATFGY